MTEIIALSQKELSRARILTLVEEGHLDLATAAESIGGSERQARRLLSRFKRSGAAGLAHGNRGRPATNRLSAETREWVLELVKGKYAGFNDTHLWEVLAERELIALGREILRILLRGPGIGPKRSGRSPVHRRRREPRAGAAGWCGGTVPSTVGRERASEVDADGGGGRRRREGGLGVLHVRGTSAAYLRLLEGVLKCSGIPQHLPGSSHCVATIAVFFPVVYVPGIAGAFFRDQALTVTFSLLVSIGAALLLQPVLSVRLLRARDSGPRGIFRLFRWVLEKIHVFYHPILVRVLRRPLPFLLAVTLGLGAAAFWGLRLERSFLPERSLGDVRLDLELPAGTPLEQTAAEVADLAAWIESLDGVGVAFSQVGRTERTLAAVQDFTVPNTARIRIILEPGRGAYERGQRLRQAIAERLSQSAEVEYAFREEGIGLGEILGTGGAEFSLGVLAEDPHRAVEAAESLLVELRKVDGLVDLQMDRVLGTTNVVVRLDRDEILRHGLDPDRIADELSARVAGVEATFFNEVDQRIDIAVRLPREERLDLSSALATSIEIENGQTVPLANFLSLEEELPLRELKRRNQQRWVTISGNVEGRAIDDVWEEAEAIAARALVPGVRVIEEGEREEMRRSFRDLGLAMLLAMVLVYMILAGKFESFLDPLLIAAVVPVGLAGSAVAIGVTGGSLNILSLIGILALLGIAVNDAIVKVDTIRRLRSEGLEGSEALLEASRLRLRPILMTSATTVLAMVPMAIGLGSGEQLQRPLAVTIIGGLSLTTMLTLFLTPALHRVAHRLEAPSTSE